MAAEPPSERVSQSVYFFGDGSAEGAGDMQRVLKVLNEGIASPEHAAFNKKLDSRR